MAAREGMFVPPDSAQGMSPADGRLALGGLLTPKGPSTLDIRPGILYGPGAGGNEPGRVTGTGSWQYSIAAGHFVGIRSAGGGPYLFSLDGATLTAAVAAAPASGSRWDLIWVRQRDFSAGDADSQAVVGVSSGVASGTPAKPYADVPVGAVVLAEAEVKAGATSTSHANVTITPVARFTVPRGCAIPVRNQAERDELTGYPGLRVRRLDTKSTEEWDNGSWGLPPDIAALIGRVMPDNGNVPNAPAATAGITSYGQGTTQMLVANDATWPNAFGLVETMRYAFDSRGFQEFRRNSSHERWQRHWSGSAWSAWKQTVTA